MSILERIVAQKRGELERARRRLPPEALVELLPQVSKPRPFGAALTGEGAPHVIAEVKRASPSRGLLRPQDPMTRWRPEDLAQKYVDGGASALSVLTDVHFFLGHPDALGACRDATALPVLRKDFILEPYQVDESRWLGADAVLLIVRLLDPAMLRTCGARARELGMDVLVEVHADDELPAALSVEEGIVGINHRDLTTMEMDMDRAIRLRDRMPDNRLVVAESGLVSYEDIERLMAAGISAFLVGETLAKSEQPERELKRLRG